MPMNLFGVSLGTGTSKLGEVLTFSLPPIETCPGASPWCRKHCYADRYVRRRPNSRRAYQINHELSLTPNRFTDLMTGVLPRIIPHFRIHVSGDFYSVAYIASWIKICLAFPQTRFWSYTRSWTLPTLLPALERLRDLPNVQLLASVDPDMPLPPSDWRRAFLRNDPRARGRLCAKESGSARSCQDCCRCFMPGGGHVIFKVR